ncbi:hypothetical protein ACEWY4_005717 [Coilia grayii]|uniref:Family with sequence similarity 98 member B n=1 Tax=Coilia grayii TaxID=363190 RepID=A0ABD1KJF4_9TELE
MSYAYVFLFVCRYDGPLLDEKGLSTASEDGLSSNEYVNLCVWLISRLNPLEKEPLISHGDGCHLEIGALLKEMSCPYDGVVSGLTSGKLNSKKDALKLLLYLASELQAAQIVNSRPVKHVEMEQKDTPAADIQAVCKTLNISQDTHESVFPTIEEKIKSLLKEVPKDHIGKPVFKHSLSNDQWAKLEKINELLSSEYQCRRRMLIKRLDVTVQSFGWSDRAKVKVDSMARAYQPKRHSLHLKTSVSLAHLLAAREDICNMVKTSSGTTRQNTACAVNRVLMGRVPDRGGRPDEIEPPPPEMPPWQKRQDGGGGRGGRGGGYGGGGGGWGGGGYGGGGGGGYGGGGGGGYGGGGGGGYGGGGGGWGGGGGGRSGGKGNWSHGGGKGYWGKGGY